MPLYISSCRTGKTFTPYLVMVCSAFFMISSIRMLFTGLVIMSFAVFVGFIFSFRIVTSFSSISSNDISLTTADAAVEWPPPLNGCTISETLASTTRLLAII